jgi:hypothetical protein
MTYPEFKTTLQGHLTAYPSGATWQELRETLKLPYDRPCPEWTKRLEKEIGLVRRKGQGRGLCWTLHPSTPASHV